MAVERVWFPNAPSGSIDAAQRAQIGIGYGGISMASPVTIIDITVANLHAPGITINLYAPDVAITLHHAGVTLSLEVE